MFIIAGIGLNSFSDDKTRKIILTGADVLRYNFSYREPEENIRYIKSAIKMIDELHSNTKILIDMPIPKIRLGDFDMKYFGVKEGEKLHFKSASFTSDCNEFIPVQIQDLGKKTKLHQNVTLGDGEISIHVTDIMDKDTIEGTVLNNGVIRYNKSFNIENGFDKEKFLNSYSNIFDNIADIRTHYIALSYINEEVNETIKRFSFWQESSNRGRIKKILKIENKAALDNIDKIIKDDFYDYILIDRGELGVNMPFELLGLIQKRLVRLAQSNKRGVIVSTQILESTINNYVPYRSEITELTNLVIAKVDAIMLCQETAVGARPSYSISVAKKIINEVEKYIK